VEPSWVVRRRGEGEDLRQWPRVPDAVLCVGPEGGWSEDELRQADEAGARRLNLGPRTLRAEAAPAVALTVLWTRWGW
jgi:16S rRNA (uracil1498-N3)-methyltransferase